MKTQLTKKLKRREGRNYIGFELVDDLQSEGINCAVVHQRLQHVFRSDYRSEVIRNCPSRTVTKAKTPKNFDLRLNRWVQSNVSHENAELESFYLTNKSSND